MDLKEERKEIFRKSENFIIEIKYLHHKLIKLESIERENEANLEKLSKLYKAGIMKKENKLKTEISSIIHKEYRHSIFFDILKI